MDGWGERVGIDDANEVQGGWWERSGEVSRF